MSGKTMPWTHPMTSPPERQQSRHTMPEKTRESQLVNNDEPEIKTTQDIKEHQMTQVANSSGTKPFQVKMVSIWNGFASGRNDFQRVRNSFRHGLSNHEKRANQPAILFGFSCSALARCADLVGSCS